MITISHAVGPTGTNKPVDVMIVQHLLNRNSNSAGLMEPLTVTGELGPDTSRAIKRFQYSAIGSKKPDGRVDPGGKTLSKLAAPVKNSDTIKTLRSVIVHLRSRRWRVRARYPATFPTSTTSASLGFTPGSSSNSARPRVPVWPDLIGFINDDNEILDVGWCAYMLATVKHECAERWRPIKVFV
jgi:hypothetical protein